MNEYTTTPTRVRVFWDGCKWSCDGADNEGRYTEPCWSADTFAELVAMLPEFVGSAPTYGVTFHWDTDRPRTARVLKGWDQ